MIVNAYTALDVFFVLLRLVLGGIVVCLGTTAWFAFVRSASPELTKLLEDRFYLVFLTALLLVALNVASWPLFYSVLQSYVPELPGAMCIYGVMQIGVGSHGPSRYLPGLVKVLQAIKPALVFVTGAWFVLYLINRLTTTSRLTGRVLIVLIALGFLACADAAVEAAYLFIPKKEEVLYTGCCTGAFESASLAARLLPSAVFDERYHGWLYTAYYGLNAGIVAALAGWCFVSPPRMSAWWLVPVLVTALASLPISVVFLADIAAPLLLQLPYHHCPYDLMTEVPETMVAIALYMLGVFSVGWACVAAWFANGEDTGAFLHEMVRHLLFLGLLGYLGSVAMMSIELALL
jgi:hypothetical protein